MLVKILVTLLGWSLLSMMVGLLVGKVISTLPEIPARGDTPPLETDLSAAGLNEAKEEMRNLGHMEQVRR